MSLADIEALLKKKIGLDTDSIGPETITRSIRQRMAACEVIDVKLYLNLLNQSNRELEELIELVIVPETWFFRDKEPFVFFRKYISSEWLPSHRNKVLRILSAPCSTGEEPYSIAISLIEAGLDTSKFQIDAVDISRKALEKAKEGIYDKNSFRYPKTNYQEKYFTKTVDKVSVIPELKESVNFIYGNMLESPFVKEKKKYNVIFCRNLLIYLDLSSREHVIEEIDKLLVMDGLLFLGHAETLITLNEYYKFVPHPRAFACKKTHKDLIKQKPFSKKATDNSVKKSLKKKYDRYNSKTTGTSRLSKINILSPDSDQSKKQITSVNRKKRLLDSAYEYADQGNIEKAASLCELYLTEHGPSARAFYLMGLIRETMGDVERAEEYYKKTIYLQPDCYDALIQLALLLENRKDMDKAMILRERALRVIISREHSNANGTV
ncbi:hypothetical protein AMJ80_01765 [bacterium SM23_31]|nr:MAG: hypothetical protein AMJ80_01765 [bacterium SM23_31]